LDDLFLPRPPQLPDGPEEIASLDPLVERQVERSPWRVRSAQWRAWALAEAAFGEGVRTHLTGMRGYGSFRGLLTINVPFRALEDHRYRESVFLAWASRDPILTRIPFLFVFHPEPVHRP
jgi:hypothetical protein